MNWINAKNRQPEKSKNVLVWLSTNGYKKNVFEAEYVKSDRPYFRIIYAPFVMEYFYAENDYEGQCHSNLKFWAEIERPEDVMKVWVVYYHEYTADKIFKTKKSAIGYAKQEMEKWKKGHIKDLQRLIKEGKLSYPVEILHKQLEDAKNYNSLKPVEDYFYLDKECEELKDWNYFVKQEIVEE